ncbi:uncharacterized protein LOC110845459 [Folsomia candida]|uniref:uncharacterized protein LOC110845459 n=1 Tax=Folsomia candida TaxID=158441 RepID=UPI000B904745|nr:uncharacterized protein LOC110845459 [Folsomia candida]
MGLCTTRRVYLLFLVITILQIISTGARQVFDFLGPLWAMILTNFLNIVFSIFGFFGGYTRRKHYLVSYTVWSILWIGWNLFIVCLYIPLPQLEMYKSPILSLGTGGFSWWETRAPGCVPDWTSETQLLVTNCMFDPRLMEFIQAGVQLYLSSTGILCSLSMLICHNLYADGDDKDFKQSAQPPNGGAQGTVPAFLSLSRQNVSTHTRASNRLYNRAPIGIPPTGGDSSDQQVGGNTMDDRLRPMTPRRVKRRSARSIQSQRFGPPTGPSTNQKLDGGDNSNKPSTSKGSSGGSARSSLRSNASRRNHRSSKRKNHFVSPVNRLMQLQHVVDSETSHDEPRRYLLRDQGHTNPVYLGAQSPKYGHAPPRPPSARSSYSNYHPARLPVNASNNPELLPNVINLNQNIFTNGGFDMSTEYNVSQHSNNTSTALYEDEVNFHPNLSPNNVTNNPPPLPPLVPNGINLSFKPQNTYYPSSGHQLPKNFPRGGGPMENGGVVHQNSVFAYPLAHSPVSQESFPMWGVSQPQSPTSNHFPSPPYQNRRPNWQMKSNNNPLQSHPHLHHPSSQQPLNSETVI